MKRAILAMAMPRKAAEQHIASFAEIITDHLIECIVYGNKFQCYNHWISELAAWFDNINNVELKISRKPRKFKMTEYRDLVFGLFGETEGDVKLCLERYLAVNTDYLPFEIDSELVSLVSDKAFSLAVDMCKILASSEPYTRKELSTVLHYHLDR